MATRLLMVPILLMQSPQPIQATTLLGHWDYQISWPDHFIGFDLEVFQADGSLQAKLIGDGHQTMDRILSSVEIHGNTARFLFKRHYDEHLYDLYQPGDLLFELINVNGKILTKWHKFSPTDSKGPIPAFKKASA